MCTLSIALVGCGEVAPGDSSDAAIFDDAVVEAPEPDAMSGDAGDDSVADTAVDETATMEDATSVEASTDADAGPCPSTTGTFAERYAAAVCEPLGDCCKSAGLPNDVENCKAKTRARILLYWDPAVCGGATFDGPQFDECVARVRAYTATCRDRWDVYNATMEFCYRAISGPSKPGAKCKSQYDCAQPTAPGYTSCASWSGPSGSGSMCVENEYVGLGAVCNESVPASTVVHQCEPGKGLLCTGHCEKAPTVGQACTSGACAVGLACNDAKTCVVPQADGAACSAAAPCGFTSVCASGTCHRLADLGEPCTVDADCQPGLEGCRSGKCVPGSFIATFVTGSGSSTCVP